MGRDAILQRVASRRSFLKTSAITAGAALAVGAVCDPALIRRLQQQKTLLPPHHRAWIWQFSTDGTPVHIASVLAKHDMGVIVKTHDGIDWMSKYDRSASAVSGPAQIEKLARTFEDAGVPFHAWSVIKGVDPVKEAQMAADVLAAGARSLTLDLEGYAGFWVGSRDDALRFGDELRRLTPFGRVDISIDARPWRLYHNVPLDEFVAITDAIWPQLYWDTFNSQGNIDLYRAAGFTVPTAGTTPEFLLDATVQILEPFAREIIPVGQGATVDTWLWERFNYRAWQHGLPQVSIWRFGVTPDATLEYLGDNRAGAQPDIPRTPTPEPTHTGTPTKTPTKTATPTKTPKPTKTPTYTSTPTGIPTTTPTPSPMPLTDTPTFTATPTV